MQELSNTAWCPVLSEAPFAGLPWPASTERVAHPRGSRPLPEAWLCSSTLRLLSTECRHAPAQLPHMDTSTINLTKHELMGSGMLSCALRII